jgi:hypothetical protein
MLNFGPHKCAIQKQNAIINGRMRAVYRMKQIFLSVEKIYNQCDGDNLAYSPADLAVFTIMGK